MRNIVNISLSPKLAREVEKTIAEGNYATKSEFFRALLRLWKEEQALQELRGSQIDVARGKAKKLSSLKKLR